MADGHKDLLNCFCGLRFPGSSLGTSVFAVACIATGREVESCAQRIEDVKAAGGQRVLGPHEIGGMGIYAQVKDSEDNIIGLWQPLQPEK